jgi:hypothetical protein
LAWAIRSVSLDISVPQKYPERDLIGEMLLYLARISLPYES